ncbi:MAG: alginate lyase family protein [Lentisphaerae bacterium]|nr:alginate lyase family protein [Lentisphaerota bacterium]
MTTEPIPSPSEPFLIPDRKTFLSALDFSSPALATVKQALDRNELEEAGRQFARHFRGRDMTSPLLKDWTSLPKNPAAVPPRAPGYLEGRLWDAYNVYDAPPTGIDWHECPLSCLTRFPIFPDLLEAAHHAGDVRYIRFIVDHALGYMNAWPIETFTGHTTREGWRHHYVVAAPWYWCMLPERLDEWAKAIAVIRKSPAVTDEELLRMLHRLLEECRFFLPQIQKHVDEQHNSGGFMIRVLGVVSAVLADFQDARQWQDANVRLLTQYLDQAFYPDGFYKELTLGYSTSIVKQTCETAYSLLDQPAMTGQHQRLRDMIAPLIALCKPTGSLPSFGDSYCLPVSHYLVRPLIERLGMPWALAFPYDRTPAPPFVSWPDPGRPAYGGYYAMRSDWTRDARYLMVDGGPWGTTHQHGDKLSFVLSAFGVDFLTDPSNTQYASNEPDALITILNAGFLHNTITVDGVDEFMKGPEDLAATTPLANRWEFGRRHVLFAGEYDFAPLKAVRWQRRLLFVDNAYWLLQDVLTGTETHPSLEQNFQFEEKIAVTLEAGTATALAGNGARLLIRPLDSPLAPAVTIADRTPHTTYSTQAYSPQEAGNREPQPFPVGRGWVARRTNKPYPAPAVTYTGRLTLPAVLTLALIPLRNGQPDTAAPDIRLRQRYAGHVRRETSGALTRWLLPARDGTLILETSPDRFEVRG